MNRSRSFRFCIFPIAILVFASRSAAVVTPAPDRAFSTNAAGADIIAQMQFESGNPVLSNLVVHFVNFSPVDATGDGVPDYEQWTGTLISPEWVLTCAHALQGTNGRGGGLVTNDIFFNRGGTSFPDPASAAIAEFRLHPAWIKSGFSNGNDIALVRLAVPVTNVTVFPRLPGQVFAGETAVLFAGYGFQGNGDTGESTNVVGSFAVGVNTLDAVGGHSMTNGYGNPNTTYSNWVSSVFFMDFDKSESRDIACVGSTNSIELLLSDFSSMGNENSVTAPAMDSCVATNAVAISNTFISSYCDFLPGAGDCGGPAFTWPNAPNLPAPGTHFITNAPTILGVMSYRARGTNPTNATSVYGNVGAFTLVQPFVGWIYQETGLAGVGPATFLRKPLDVQLASIRILAEHPVGGNETDIEFTTDIQNIDTGRYRELAMNVVSANLPASLSIIDSQLKYPTLTEMGTVIAGSDDKLVVRVANVDLIAARSAILNGSALELTAFEEQVYTGPQKYIDKPTDNAFESTTGNLLGELVLVFGSATTLTHGLQPGDLLIADPTPGAYRPKQPSQTEQFPVPYLSQQFPFEVSSVNLVDGKTHVAGHKRELFEILKSGTFVASGENFNGSHRDLLDPPVENTYTEEEKEDRAERGEIIKLTDPSNSGLADLLGMNAIPFHFNDVEITEHLHLSGQVLLRSSGLRAQFSFRNFALKKASIGLDAGVVASLVLETSGTNDNINAPKQQELADIPLVVVPFTVAGVPCSIDLGFVLSVGAGANAPAGLSIPLETSATIGAEIGWTNGQTFSTPISEFVAPHISDPTVFDAVSLSAKAWVEARLEAKLSVAGGLASAGPSLGIRAQAEFTVEPFNDPWWTMDADADLVGAFELNFLGLNVARVETTNHIATFFHKDAGGPLIPAPSASGDVPSAGDRSATPSLIPTAGTNTRWGLAFAAQTSDRASYSKGFVTPLNGGGFYLGAGQALLSFLGVVSATGEIVWMQDFPNGAKPVDGLQMSDGSLMVAGTLGQDWWLAQYDTNGVRQWVVSRRVLGDLRDFEIGTATNGDPEFYLAGFSTVGIVTQDDPVMLKFDKDGNLLWSKAYTLSRDDEVYAIRKLADGNFALVGRTYSPVGIDPIIGAGNSGLLMKINPAGDVLWATAVAGRWGILFRDVAEAPDGSIFAVGAHGDIVVDYYPSIMVAKFSANGELVNHVLIGEDPDGIDELPNGGDTPYDTATQAAWTSNGLVVVGNTGIGLTKSAFAMCVTDELGVRWFSAFDGPNASVLEDVAVTDAGIAALGWVEDVWPIEFENRTPAWLLSLPWEGMMQFHPDTGVKSAYLQPHVFLSSADTDFLGRFNDAAGSFVHETHRASFFRDQQHNPHCRRKCHCRRLQDIRQRSPRIPPAQPPRQFRRMGRLLPIERNECGIDGRPRRRRIEQWL